jgi:hypothetical protein
VRSPNFVLAFLLAPLAGAITAALLILVATTAAGGASLGDNLDRAAMVGVLALAICALFTLVVGGCAAAYVRSGNPIPSLVSALSIGFAVAAGVSVLLVLLTSTQYFLGLASFVAACGLSTAWAFWCLGLRGRIAASDVP